jgi:hypothetical protein
MHNIYNIIIIFINNNNNNTIINNNYGGSKTVFCFSKFQWPGESISFVLVGNLGTRPQKGFASPGLVQKQDSGGGYNRKCPSYLLLLLLCLLFLLSHNSFVEKFSLLLDKT